MTCDDGKDMKKLIAELKKNGEEFDVWYDISNLISAQKQELSKYKNMVQIYANIIGSNEDDLSNDLIKLVEDAKKLHGTEIMLKRCQELGIEDSLKYHDLMNANSEIVQHNIDITKDRQIVKRLEERIKMHDEVKKELKEKLQLPDNQAELFQACQSDMLTELQKIRDGKEC